MKTVTISTEEYRRLLQSEDLAHRQRFTIKNLERELERQKARSSRFAHKTLNILLNHYTMEELMLLYKEGECRH